AEQVQKLLRAGSNDDVVDGGVDVGRRERIKGGGAGEQFLAQRSVTLSRAVLQNGLSGLRPAEQVVQRRFDLSGRQRLVVHQPGGQADQVRVLHRLLHVITDRL